ncbi:MAG TPA: hypothetical protein VNG31_08605, partial [Candidatus Baltobacteraceae bacterium]|nr:hypothetical protein [Candidatus Baltobacteraceae bacterium]
MMRQRFYLLALAFAFGLASCTSKATLAPLPPQSPQYVRGSILWMHRVGTLTKAEMNAGLAGKAIAELGGPAQCNVSLYAIKYRTIGAQGEPADASAAFFVPGPGCGRHAYTLVG